MAFLASALGTGLTQRDALIVALSLGVGLAAPSSATWLATLPAMLKSLLESGIAAGGLTALVLNLVLPRRDETTGAR